MIAGKRASYLAAALIAVAAFGAYANTFRSPFIFDDVASIVDNPTIRQLWPPSQALSPPQDWGFTVSGRPLLNLSLAVNYAISGLEVWSYHVLNLGIHIAAGLLLFGIVLRTLRQPPVHSRLRAAALPLATMIAAVWTLHPLQTEAVTYVIQRAESLMGMLFLLTLYAFIRAQNSPQPFMWSALSFFACLGGIATKEVAVLAPVMVLLYDRTFVSGSFREAWRRNRWQHGALLATWVPLGLLLAGTGGNRGGTAGFDVGVPWLDYWLTQFEAITRYLGLAFWPHPLAFDYGKIPPPEIVAAFLWAIPVVVLAVATLWSLWRHPVPGFLGAWFFALLAPTSVVPGTLQMIVEHRMYLPLAAVVAFAFGTAAIWLQRRLFITVGAGLVLAGGLATASHNSLYANEQALWENALVIRPSNARAHNNLGLLFYNNGRIDDATRHYQESVRLDPGVAQAHYNLGLAFMKLGRLDEAVAAFNDAVRIIPYYFSAHLNAGMVLIKLGQAAEALPYLREAIRYDPSPSEAEFQLGVALAQLERWSEAVEHYAKAVQLNPRHAEAHSNLGVALFHAKSTSAAIEHFNTALALNPGLFEPHFNLALALAQAGKTTEAIEHLEQAARLRPDSPAVRDMLQRLRN